MAAYVSSVLFPSTKISSVPAPIWGTRSKIRGMLPASLRAATITLTTGSGVSTELGVGRATMKLVSANKLKGHNLARNLLAAVSRSGVRKGHRISEFDRTASKAERYRRLATSAAVSQFWVNIGFTSPRLAAIRRGISQSRL